MFGKKDCYRIVCQSFIKEITAAATTTTTTTTTTSLLDTTQKSQERKRPNRVSVFEFGTTTQSTEQSGP